MTVKVITAYGLMETSYTQAHFSIYRNSYSYIHVFSSMNRLCITMDW